MILQGTMRFQCAQSRPGYKDPSQTLYEVALVEKMDSIICRVDKELFDKITATIEEFTPCKCEFDFNTKFNSLRLTKITPVK